MDRQLSLLVKFAALDRLTTPLRTMTGGSKKASAALAATRKEVLGLERASADVSAFKKQQASLTTTYEKLDAARRRVDALKAAIRQADGPTGRLTQQMKGAQREVDRLSEQTGIQSDRLGVLRGKLSGAGVDVRKLGAAEGELARKLGLANTRLTEQQDKARRAADQAARLDRARNKGEALRSAGYRGLAVGGAIGLPLVKAAGMAREFDSAMVDIGITAGIGARQTRLIGDNILRLAPAVGQLPADLQAAFGSLTAQGLDAITTQKMLVSIGRTSTAENANALDIANAAFSAYNNLKVPIAQIAKAQDIMAKGSQDGAVELKDMARLFPTLTAAAQGLGQHGVAAVADLTAALEIAKNGAADADEAGNNVANLLNKINTANAITNFKKFGIDLPKAMKKAYAEGKTPIEAIIELTKKATKGDLSKLSFLFNDAQVQAALRPLIQGFDEYKRVRADAMNATGKIDADFARKMREDPATQQRAAMAQMIVAAQRVGGIVLPVWNALVVKAGAAAAAFSRWADAHPTLSKWLVLIAAGVAGITTTLGAFAIGLGFVWPSLVRGITIMGKLGPVLSFASRGFLMLGQAALRAGLMMLANPIVAIIAAIVVALAVAGYLIWKHWDKIKAAFSAAIGWFKGLWPVFKHIGSMMLQGLVDAMNPLLLAQHILKLGKMAIGVLKRVLGIHSPSRVFAEIGGHMMGGLAVGLDRGVDRPLNRLRAAGAALTGAMAVTAVAAAPVTAASPRSAARGGDHYEIHVHGTGKEAKTIADEVMRHIAAHKRKSNASSFEDRD